jgi:hypothetical protein
MNFPAVVCLGMLHAVAGPAVSQDVQTARIALVGRAYVHMPLWIQVDLPGQHQQTVRYPITIYPTNFGGHDFEVRHNGQALSKIKTAAVAPKVGGGPISLGAIGGGSLLGLPHEPRHTGRLPLHLAFRFAHPGRYQVRYTGYDVTGVALVRSSWLSIQVEPYPEQQRVAWLNELAHSKPADTVDHISGYLPSLLALPDSNALRMLEPALYRGDELVRQYAMYALYLFDDLEISRWMPDVLKRRGPTPELAYFLSWRQSLFRAQANQLLTYVSEHLGSNSPLVAGGALQALAFLKHYSNVKSSPPTDALVIKRAESMMRSNSRDVLQPLALYLGEVKTDASRRLLWRLVEQGTVREQALICLTWIADRRDLPRLATYAARYQLEYHLRRAYWQAAEPFLTTNKPF